MNDSVGLNVFDLDPEFWRKALGIVQWGRGGEGDL
jgi:hypothetical protein